MASEATLLKPQIDSSPADFPSLPVDCVSLHQHGNDTNPWGKVNSDANVSTSFNEVLSEELAKCLHEKELVASNLGRSSLPVSSVLLQGDELDGEFSTNDCSDDHLLAKMLQAEYDKEHDLVLDKEERKYNGNCKVSLSFENFRKIPNNCSSSSDSDEDFVDDIRDNKAWDSFEKREKSSPIVGKTGIIKHSSGHITTKHDADICGRRNASKVMQFPPGFETGDGGGFDMILSNKVYNKLKVHSKAENKRSQRLHDKKDKSTAEQVLDPKTRLLIYKLVNSDVLKSVNGCVSTGKEACVFHGYGGQFEGRQVPTECALKVFKTTLNEFVCRDKYIADDYRFRDRFSKQNPRKFIRLWAEKEMHNLKRLNKAGIRCPEVVLLKKHILLMSFVGIDGKPASKLKDVQLSEEKWQKVFSDTVNIMKKMYDDCNLIHADFSEYNILWHCNQIWIIDVSQSVEPTHPHALEFLYRDCTNICQFFEKRGVVDVPSPKQLFCDITKLNLPDDDTELVSAIQNYEKNKEVLQHGTDDTSESFDYLFDKISRRSQTNE